MWFSSTCEISTLIYIYVVCVLWLISVDLVCISRVILCSYVLEVSHSLVVATYELLHLRDHLVDYVIDLIFSKSCFLCMFLCFARVHICRTHCCFMFYVWCFICHVAFMLCPMYLFSRMFCCFVSSQRVMLAVCDCLIWQVSWHVA